jgi:uncharacterized membrane protein YfcA
VTPGSALVLAGAGFLAGAVNAVAGGGSLISFPAMLAVGYPALRSNVTNTVAIWPGYLGSTAAYRPELEGQRPRVVALSVSAVAGAVVGSIVLLTTPAKVFRSIVPFLILAAAALLAVQPLVTEWVRRLPGAHREHNSGILHAGMFIGGVYGAYFGGGLGVMLLAILGLFISDGLQRVNALKTLLSLIINTVALIAFVLFGPVIWSVVLVVAPSALLGGYAGAGVARRLPANVLRVTIVIFAVAVAIALLVK